MPEEKEFGRIKINEHMTIVIRKVFYEKKSGIDIRYFLTGIEKHDGTLYTGWSKEGVRVYDEKQLKEMIMMLSTAAMEFSSGTDD